MNQALAGVVFTLAAFVMAAAIVVAMRWRRGQPLTVRFLFLSVVLMTAAVLLSAVVSAANLSPAVMKPVLASALFAGAAFEGFYAIKYWRLEGWSLQTRQLAFGLLTAIASAIAVLYFL